MTIANTPRKAGPSQGNGVNTAFPFTFKIFSGSDILATYLDATGNELVLTLGTDYTVALNADQNAAPGGTVTLLWTPASGTYITLTSQVTNTQNLALTNAGGFYPTSINDALDRIVIQVQQLAEQVARAAKAPLSGIGSLTPSSLVFGVDATGTPILSQLANISLSAVSTFMSTLLGLTSSQGVQGAILNTAQLYKDATGNVGIGTTNPVASGKLTVYESVTDKTIGFFYQAKNSGGSSDAFIIRDDRGYNGINSGSSFVCNAWSTGNDTGKLFSFSTTSDGATLVPVMIGSLAGNVGIGTTAPSAKLEVNGAIKSTSMSLSTSPTANPTAGAIAATYSAINAQTTTTKGTTNREWCASFGITNTGGYGAANNNGDKVTLYAGMDMQANAGDGWALNTVMTVNPSAPALCMGYGYECDFNNNHSHRDNYGAGSLFGLGVTGAGSFRSTAAILISGVTAIWQRGISIGSVVNNSIEDTSNSVTCLSLNGTHTSAIDVSSGVFTNIFKVSDNASSLGSPGNRWSSIWSANGTIQTSDVNTKKDIISSPLGLDFIKSLRPVAYKFKVGGNVPDLNHVPDASNRQAYIPVAGTRQHFGLIAQEVKAALPVSVDFGGWILTDSNNPDSEQGLRYEEFIAPLIKAVQEQQSIIEILTARLTSAGF